MAKDSVMPYWRVAVDQVGTIHLSWVWRESPDVASNHDLCYAKSTDGGISWLKSTGEKYQLPITATNAEYTVKIPQQSELINQTSMFADAKGNVFIAGYWRGANETGPQYHLVFKTDSSWKVSNLNFRKTTFSLSGTGTKRIPISRPQIIVWPNGKYYVAGLLFRDAERGNKASIALNDHLGSENWIIKDLTKTSMGDWEPTYDTELWKTKSILSLFLQNVTQIDGEGKAEQTPTQVQVLDWKPKNRITNREMKYSSTKYGIILLLICLSGKIIAQPKKLLVKSRIKRKCSLLIYLFYRKFEGRGSHSFCSEYRWLSFQRIK